MNAKTQRYGTCNTMETLLVAAGVAGEFLPRVGAALAAAGVLDRPLGRLRPGGIADVCVFDPNATWIVGDDTLVSRGKNTPLRGATLTGRVRWTVLGGRVVFQGLGGA